MRRRSFGWVALLGVVCIASGVWAFSYACNTETAACKGAAPWPPLAGFLYRASWVMVVLGLVLIVVAIVGAITRAAARRRRVS